MGRLQFVGLVIICMIHAAESTATMCMEKRADVLFIVDSSDAIWRPDFGRQMTFVRDVINEFHVGARRTRVGLVTLSDRPRLVIPLAAKRSFVRRTVLNMRQDGGSGDRASLADAMLAAREAYFATARPDVTKMTILLTSGSWRRDDKMTHVEATATRQQAGVQMFAVGIGANVGLKRLGLTASQPSAYYTFHVSNFANLKNIRQLLAAKVCAVMSSSPDKPLIARPVEEQDQHKPQPHQPPVIRRTPYILHKPTTPNIIAHEPSEQNYAGARFGTLESYGRSGKSNDIRNEFADRSRTAIDGREQRLLATAEIGRRQRRLQTPQGCVPKVPLDIIFVVASKTNGRVKNRQLWKFVRRTLSGINMSSGRVRARFLHSGMHVSNKTAQPTGVASSADLIRSMAQRLRERVNATSGTGERTWPIGVFVTDGASGELEATMREAQAARLNDGVELFAVAVGDEVNLTEMRAIPSCPMEKHLLTAESHTRLPKLTHRLTKRLCFGKRRRR